ncbi:MAG: hypothetical protein WC375_09545 [Methanomassiliicoccales archaeon]|jgi:hypothetical protein
MRNLFYAPLLAIILLLTSCEIGGNDSEQYQNYQETCPVLSFRNNSMVVPPEWREKVYGWMLEAISRSGGQEYPDFVCYEWIPYPCEGYTSKGYPIYTIHWRDASGERSLQVGGHSVGTQDSGRYNSSFAVGSDGGTRDRYGIWEAMNVLSGLIYGQMLDGAQPNDGTHWQWP